MSRFAAALAAFTLAGLAPAVQAAGCPGGAIAMYISGKGEFCPDASGRYTVPVAPAAPTPAPASMPAPAPAAPAPAFDLGGGQPPAPRMPALPSPAAAPAGAMESGNVRLLQSCVNVTCRVQEGFQSGLTTVEVHGQAPQYEGRSLEFLVATSGDREVIRRKVGVMIGGAFTTSIAAYNLPAGEYVFGFRPVGGNRAIAGGMFEVGAAKTAPSSRQPARAAGSVVGTWYGVGGTMGKLELRPDGSYTSNGAPAGRYHVSGNVVTFTGNLAAWNGGRATLTKPDLMEFHWRNPSGGINYFAFGKY